MLAGAHLVAHGDGRHLELVAAEARAAVEDGDVAAIGVDVQVVGVEVADADPHARSQYGSDEPALGDDPRSASIAV